MNDQEHARQQLRSMPQTRDAILHLLLIETGLTLVNGTLVKTANEFVRRHEQQLHATLHQSITVTANAGRVTVNLDIVPDEDNPYATLSAQDDSGELLAELKVAPSFKLNRSSAVAWVDGGFARLR